MRKYSPVNCAVEMMYEISSVLANLQYFVLEIFFDYINCLQYNSILQLNLKMQLLPNCKIKADVYNTDQSVNCSTVLNCKINCYLAFVNITHLLVTLYID